MEYRNAPAALIFALLLCMGGSSCEKNTASTLPCSPFGGITRTDSNGKVISRDPDDWNGGRGVYPNPAKQAVSLTYSLSQRGRVRITINDRVDRVVATLIDREQGAGTYQIAWFLTNDAGEPLPDCIYRLFLTITDPTDGRIHLQMHGDIQIQR